MKKNNYILFLLLGLLISCHETQNNHTAKTLHQDSYSGKIIPINFSDSNYMELRLYAIDTITKDNWKIQYLVKDDSTKYKDIYIECSKEKYKGIFRFQDILEMRRYFIPEYAGETKTHIIFTHGCATDCSGVLVFDKDSTPQFTDYLNVVDFNINFGLIVYVSDNTYQHEENTYELVLVDLQNRKRKTITYKDICMNVYKPDGVDTIIFKPEQVTIKTKLVDARTHMKEITETRIIQRN